MEDESARKFVVARLRSRPSLVLLTVLLAVASGLFYRQRLVQIGTAALVNGERISVKPIDKLITKLKAKDPARFRGEGGERVELALRKQMIDGHVQLRIISQAARAAGITIDDEEIESELRTRAADYADEAQFFEAMEADGYSPPVLRDEVRDLLAEQKMREKLAGEATVAKREIDSYIAANAERLASETEQIRLTEVKVSGKEQADEVGRGEGAEQVAARAEKLGLPVESYWQRQHFLTNNLREAFLQADARGIVSPLPHPDNTLSMYAVHEIQVRKSGAEELRQQVRRKLLWDRQQESFNQWLAGIQASASVQIFD